MAIHPTAIIDPDARIAEDVEIGPFSVVEGDTVIGKECRLLSHVLVGRDTTIGEGNTIYGPSTIGYPPQDLKFQGGRTRCEIGDNNTIREFVTIHRGTEHGGGLTKIGSHGLYMAYAHIAHDCIVGDHVIFANAGTLAGHVEVGDHAGIGAFSAVHQFCRVGAYAYMGGFTVATQDVLPYCKTVGSRPAKVYGINTIGLERQGFTKEDISGLKKAFRRLFMGKDPLAETLPIVEKELGGNPYVQKFITFIRDSERGIVSR